jgi:hypothetical protein
MEVAERWPRVGVGVILVNARGEVLIGQRKGSHGVGGGISSQGPCPLFVSRTCEGLWISSSRRRVGLYRSFG